MAITCYNELQNYWQETHKKALFEYDGRLYCEDCYLALVDEEAFGADTNPEDAI